MTNDMPILRSSSAGPVNGSGLSWPLLVAAGAFLLFLTRQELLNDPDTYWHIATGRWIYEHLAIPTTDPFSNSMLGAPWTAHEWLSELVYFSAYAAGGWTAVVAVAAAAFAAALAILTRYLLRHVEAIYALFFVVMAATLALPHLLARPHTLAAPLLVFWGVVLLRAREESRAPSRWLALLLALWANLHGGFPIALLLAAAFACEAILAATDTTARWCAARQWGSFMLAALLASLLTPHGLDGLLFASNVHKMDFTLDTIAEWRSPDFHELQWLEVWLMVTAAAVLTRGLRLPAVRLILILGLLHFALRHVRHCELLGLMGPLIIAEPFAAQWFVSSSKEQQSAMLDRLFASLAGPASKPATSVVLGILAVPGLAAIRIDHLHPSPESTPASALRAIQEAFPENPTKQPGRVLNSYDFGGYLIFAGVSPYIDGRADLYGDAFVRQYVRTVQLEDPELLPQLLASQRIGWTLLKPGEPAIGVLDHLPGWRRFHVDKTAVVHVREATETMTEHHRD